MALIIIHSILHTHLHTLCRYGDTNNKIFMFLSSGQHSLGVRICSSDRSKSVATETFCSLPSCIHSHPSKLNLIICCSPRTVCELLWGSLSKPGRSKLNNILGPLFINILIYTLLLWLIKRVRSFQQMSLFCSQSYLLFGRNKPHIHQWNLRNKSVTSQMEAMNHIGAKYLNRKHK
jgi:hypothetical protein